MLAGRIVQTLGTGALEIILDKPQRLAEVPGVGPKRAKIISQAVADHGALRDLMVFLQSHGVAATTALRIYRRYGAGAMGVVQNKPHRLASDVRGIGFATADAIAARLGIAADHPERLQAGLLWILGTARDEGHVYLPYDELLDRTAAELRVERSLLGPAFARLHSEQEIVAEDLPSGRRVVYLIGQHAMEMLAAEELARISRQPGLLTLERAAKAVAWAAGQLAVKPSRSQAHALEGLLEAGLGVLHRRAGHRQNHPGQGYHHHSPAHGAYSGPGRAHRPGGQAPGPGQRHGGPDPAPPAGVQPQGEPFLARAIQAPGARAYSGGRVLHDRPVAGGSPGRRGGDE